MRDERFQWPRRLHTLRARARFFGRVAVFCDVLCVAIGIRMFFVVDGALWHLFAAAYAFYFANTIRLDVALLVAARLSDIDADLELAEMRQWLRGGLS